MKLKRKLSSQCEIKTTDLRTEPIRETNTNEPTIFDSIRFGQLNFFLKFSKNF